MSRVTGDGSAGPAGGLRLAGSRRGDVGKAIESALEGATLRGDQIVFAALAKQAARAVDAAIRADDLSAMLRSMRELRELVDLLPLRTGAEVDPESEGGEREHGGNPRARVFELLDSPPSVGN